MTPTVTITLPFSFSTRTVAYSAQVNADLEEIRDKFNAHSHNSLSFTPGAAAAGDGVFIDTASTYSVDVTDGSSLSLLHFSTHNLDTVGAASQLYTVWLEVDTDATDTGAGLAIKNTGKSDCVYLDVKGKAASASTPSGIGCDVNRSGTGENSALNAGTGFHGWDWSVTDQGANGPRAALFRKHKNPNSTHHLVEMYADRWALVFNTPEDGTTGYDGSQPLINVSQGGTGLKWRITAAGNEIFANTLGTYFTMGSGPQGYVIGTAGSALQIRGGASNGVIVRNSADSANNFQVADGGSITFRDGATLNFGSTTGVKVGASSDKLSFYGATPIVKPSAYTQTYATADKTHANPTAVALTDSTAGTANTTLQALPDPADTPATADALRDDLVANLIPSLRNNYADLAASNNAIIGDLADVKQLVNSVIDDLQALGLVG